MKRNTKFPVVRDVSVNRRNEDAKEASKAVEEKNPMANLVTVLGFDRNDVLFKSDSVGVVQWRDSEGRPVALLVRLKPDIWGFCKRGDDDWEEVLKIYGSEEET